MALGGVIFLAASWLLVLTVLVLEFAGILRRGAAWRWQGAGVLIINSAGLINTFARFRGWPYSQLRTVASLTVPVTISGGVILAIGLVVLARERRRARRAGYPGE